MTTSDIGSSTRSADTSISTTTQTDDPDVIRREIDATRAGLSRDVDALTEKVSPSRAARRGVDRAKSRFGSAKDRVMGSSGGAAQERASSLASSAGDALGAAPRVAQDKVDGSPLAAGLIAFGVGWLAASLIPSTSREQAVASAAKDEARARSDALTQPLKEAGRDAADNLRAPATDAVDSVRARAADAAGNVRGEAQDATDELSGSGRHGTI
jgi:Protein of unknown function (DUF3618)